MDRLISKGYLMQSLSQPNDEGQSNPTSDNPADWPQPMREVVQILRDCFTQLYAHRDRVRLERSVKEAAER